jgi:hypothetical protein
MELVDQLLLVILEGPLLIPGLSVILVILQIQPFLLLKVQYLGSVTVLMKAFLLEHALLLGDLPRFQESVVRLSGLSLPVRLPTVLILNAPLETLLIQLFQPRDHQYPGPVAGQTEEPLREHVLLPGDLLQFRVSVVLL